MAHDPQLCTFDNNGGAGDGMWDTATNWDGVVPNEIPEDGDWVKISANCTCDTDESAAVLSGGNSVVDADMTLTMATGGHIKFQDRDTTVAATAVLAFDGGTITQKATTTTARYLRLAIVTCTANGGTINLPSDTAEKSYLYIATVSASIVGHSSNRIIVDGSGGTSWGYVYIYTSDGAVIRSFEFKNMNRILCSTCDGVLFDDCIMHTFRGTYGMRFTSCQAQFKDSYIYNAGSAIANGAIMLEYSDVHAYDLVLGKDELENSSANGTDLYAGRGAGFIGRNCSLASATPVGIVSGNNCRIAIVSTGHNQVKDAFKCWYGRGHTVETEASGQAGNGMKLVSNVVATDTDFSRLRYLIGTIPATHGNTINVTVYVKGTTGKTCTLRIDPESIYGTTQEKSVAGSTGNWVQETIPQYTVNTEAGLKHAIPVYIDVVGASETWYVDTFAATVT